MFNLVREDGLLQEQQGKKIFVQKVAAIHYCHNVIIVHGDLKYQTIFQVADRNVKLIEDGFQAKDQSSEEIIITFKYCPKRKPKSTVSAQGHVKCLTLFLP